MKNPIEEKCSLMAEEELLRALTIEKDEYNEAFLKIARLEVDKRGIKLSELANQATLRFNDQKEEMLPLESICAKLKEPLSIWDSYSLTNFIGETLLIQAEGSGRLVHYFYKSSYDGSFLIDSVERLEKIVRIFCRADDWSVEIEEEIYLDDWVVFINSPSREYVETIITALGKSEIPCIVRGENLPRFDAIFGTYSDDSLLKILIPETYIDAAGAVLAEIDKAITALLRQAEAFAEQGDFHKELEIYEHLTKLLPNDELVFFVRGVALFELERYEEAVRSFSEAAVNAQTNRNIPIAEDSKSYLQQMEEKMPDNVELLHALASFSLEAEDLQKAEEYYRRILSCKADDEIAHLNLGHIYYHDPNLNRQALAHFRKYLELKPEAEDRETIEAIISELQ